MLTSAQSARHYCERVAFLDTRGAYNLALVELGQAIRHAEHDQDISVSWVSERQVWVCENKAKPETLTTRNPVSVAAWIKAQLPCPFPEVECPAL